MRPFKLLLSTICWATLSAQAQQPTLIINELMQSNVDCVMDDLNDFPDSWVELYNVGSEMVNLNNYRLGETDQAAEAWKLPAMMLSPKQHVLVYCDKAAQGRHTPFRLESGKGCSVYLFRDTTVIDQVTDLKEQPRRHVRPRPPAGRRRVQRGGTCDDGQRQRDAGPEHA